MSTVRSRMLSALAVGVLAVAGAVALDIAPAGAAPAAGELQIKGAGSLYTRNYIVNQSGAPGKVIPWTVKVVNTGGASAQYKVTLTQPTAPVTAAMYNGSVLIPSDTYYTPFIAPGKFVLVTVKATVPVNATQGFEHLIQIGLADAITNTTLDGAYADLFVAAPAKGSQANDLFIKTGAQAFVGGSASGQFITAAAIKPGSTATYTVRLQNDRLTAATVTLTASSDCGAPWITTLKNGATNITSAVFGGGGFVVPLAGGAHKDLVLTEKLGAATGCLGQYARFTSSAVGETTLFDGAHAVVAA